MGNNMELLNNMSLQEMREEINKGARFVIFPWCVSIVVMTFRRSSGVHFFKSGQSSLPTAFKYILISLLFGWWGIPWGPIYTVSSLLTNFSGGKNITKEMLEEMTGTTN
jgi:hypothetical protein